MSIQIVAIVQRLVTTLIVFISISIIGVQRLVTTLIVFISISIIGACMKIDPGSSWNLPPTAAQIAAITRMSCILGIKESLEDTPSNRLEARRLQSDLVNALRRRHKR